MVASNEVLLRYILKLCQASIAFSAADELLRTWLEVMATEPEIQKVSKLGSVTLFAQ